MVQNFYLTFGLLLQKLFVSLYIISELDEAKDTGVVYIGH